MPGWAALEETVTHCSSAVICLLNEWGLVGRQLVVHAASLRAIPEVVSLSARHRKV